MLALVTPAVAQAPLPGIERRALPDGLGPDVAPSPTAPPPAPGFELPPIPELPPAGPFAGPSVFVRRIRIEGNTALTEAELRPVLRRYEGRAATVEELLRLRDEITLAYVRRGYVNSGAVLPDQEVRDGAIVLRVVEGGLDEVRLGGLASLDPAFLERRVRLGAGVPLDVNALQERLQLLLLDPAIERLNARLGPGARPGGSRLEADVVEARRLRIDARVANDRSPSVGEWHGEVAATYLSLLGRGDPLSLALGLTDGAREASAAYEVPLTPRGLRLQAAGEFTDSDIVERPFNELDIQSRSWSVEFGLSYPLVERLDDGVRVGLALARRHSETFLLDEPFSFSPGTEDGESDITVLRLRQDWDHRGRDVAFALRSTFSLGLDALGATRNDGGPDGRFRAWLGQGELAWRPFGGDHQLLVRGGVQLAADPLLPLEQFAIGGVDSVRGYRENLLVRDDGYAASVEYRLPVFRAPIPGWSAGPEDGIVYLAPFADLGGGFDEDDEGETGPDAIYSVGTGLRWSPSLGFEVVFYGGLPLNDVPDPNDAELQDAGVHLELRARLY